MEVLTELLPCPLCKLPHFENVHSLRSTLIIAATRQLHCPVCNECVLGLDKLTIHLFSHINDNLNTNDNIPTVEVPEMKSVGRNEFASVPNELEKFNSFPNKLETNQIICDICNFTFSNQTILELHQKLLHQTNPDKENGDYNFHCHLCTKKFKMKGSLIVHLRVAHYGFSDSVFEKNKVKLLKLDSNEAQRSGDTKQWKCEICCKMFTTKYFLKKHKRLHTGEMPYTCSQCNKAFTFQQSYHKHMLYHSSEKPYTCDACGRSFKELSTLQNHARIHSGERPFSCETCGKSFRQRVSYLVHRRIHTGVMPYECKLCGKKFRYKVSQRSHKCAPIPPSENFNTFTIHEIPLLNPEPLSEEKGTTTLVNQNLMTSHEEKYPNYALTDSNSQRFISPSLQNDSNPGYIIGETVNANDIYSMIFSPLLSEVEPIGQILQN